jgi:DNA-binding transcriptional LysR family regulator
MLIDYGLLPTLLELANGQTFAQAAQRLHITPSAVSHQVRALEEQLGVQLFERVGRRARLSAQAKLLAECVRQHLPPIQAALDALSAEAQGLAGAVRIGGALPFSRLWLRPRLVRLLKTQPELEPQVSFGPPSVLLPKLEEGTLDFAVVAEPVEAKTLVARVVYVEKLWAVCAKSYLAAAPPPTTLKELGAQRFVIYDDHRPMHDIWWRAMFGRCERPAQDVRCAVANLDEMLHLVESGVGIAVLPNYLVGEAVRAGKLLRVGPQRRPAPQNPIHLVWRKHAIETARFKLVRDSLLAR